LVSVLDSHQNVPPNPHSSIFYGRNASISIVNVEKKITWASILVSLGICVLMILAYPTQNWTLVVLIIGVLVAGQSMRYVLIQLYRGRGKPKKMSKKEMEREVRQFFQDHQDIAKRFLRMDELRKKGKFTDALAIANSLKREDLSPVVMRYIEFKIKQFEKNQHFE
jgi:hypothetical protein